MNISKYWHEKLDIPIDIIKKLKILASKGELVNNNILKVSAEDFKYIFKINREYLYRGDCTAPVEEQDYSNNRNYVTMDGLSGFSITPNGWIVSLFSNNKHNNILKVLNSFTNNNSKIVVITNNNWQKSHLILKYINELKFKPIAVTTDSTKWMENKYGHLFTNEFTNIYGKPLIHIFLIKDNVSSINTLIKNFDSFNEAYDYINNL